MSKYAQVVINTMLAINMGMIAKEGPTLVTGEGLHKHMTLTGVLKDGEGKHLVAGRCCWYLWLEQARAASLSN